MQVVLSEIGDAPHSSFHHFGIFTDNFFDVLDRNLLPNSPTVHLHIILAARQESTGQSLEYMCNILHNYEFVSINHVFPINYDNSTLLVRRQSIKGKCIRPETSEHHTGNTVTAHQISFNSRHRSAKRKHTNWKRKRRDKRSCDTRHYGIFYSKWRYMPSAIRVVVKC